MATQPPPPDALEISVHPPLPPPLTAAGDRDNHLQGPFRRWASWLVPAFVVANVVMFLVTMYVNDCPRNNSRRCAGIFLGRFAFQPLKENPLLGPSSATLEKMGALYAYDITHEHQAWRLFSCVWLHAGVVHIFANMLSLLLIGIRLEQEFGFVRIGLLYLISGFGGSVMSALFIKSSISVGASGALFGLLGGMLSELLTNWTIYANKCAALLTLIIVIVINLALGFLPHVDKFAHIGGFVSGFLLGFVVLIRPQYGWVSQKKMPPGRQTRLLKHKYKTYQYVLWVVAVILLIVWLAVGTAMLFKGGNANEYCSWCSHLGCGPMSKRSCSSPAAYCLTSQDGQYLNLTCGDRSTTHTFALPNATDAHVKELCTQMCS